MPLPLCPEGCYRQFQPWGGLTPQGWGGVYDGGGAADLSGLGWQHIWLGGYCIRGQSLVPVGDQTAREQCGMDNVFSVRLHAWHHHTLGHAIQTESSHWPSLCIVESEHHRACEQTSLHMGGGGFPMRGGVAANAVDCNKLPVQNTLHAHTTWPSTFTYTHEFECTPAPMYHKLSHCITLHHTTYTHAQLIL